MQYDNELKPLLEWIASHPGLTCAGIEKSIKAIPWPDGNSSTWNPPYDGTRLSRECPNIHCITWKLRYMELTGDVRREKNKWYATMPN